MNAAVFLITGPSGAGKSTVAERLASRFRRGVHVEGDVFRRSVVSGRQEMLSDPSREALAQLRLRHRLAASAADMYFSAGFTVAVEDVVAGDLLEDWPTLVKSRPLNVVVLLPSISTVVARDQARATSGYRDWPVERLYHVFSHETPRVGLWLDTSHDTPDETVDQIVRAFSN